jgi:branched-chain amino acid transport system substrate-binding protein
LIAGKHKEFTKEEIYMKRSFRPEDISIDAIRTVALNRRQLVTCMAAATLTGLGLPAQSSTEGTVRIGQVIPLTGPIAPVSIPIVEGQRVYIDEVNAKGGVNGNRIELITLDDAFDSKKTLEQTNVLLNEKDVSALFGYGTGGGIAALQPLLLEKKIPLLGIYSGADQLRAKHNPYMFITSASFGDEMRQMVRHVITLQNSKLAVSLPPNGQALGLRDMIEKLAKEAGATIVAFAEMAQDGSNAAAVVDQLSAKEPHAILLMAVGTPVLAFMKAASGKVKVPIYTLSVSGSSAFLRALGPAAHGMAISQVIPFPWRTTSPLTRQFAASMERAKLDVTYDRMWGYLNAAILVEALRRAGKQPTPQSITAAIDGMSDVDVGGYRLNFSKTNHIGSRFVEMTMVGSRGDYVR